MTARYFFGNTLAAFFRSSTTVGEVTTAGRFDSALVGSGISMLGPDYVQTMPFIDAASTTSLWIHCEVFPNINNVTFIQFLNSSGVVVARLNNGNQFQYWNGTTFVNYGSATSLLTAGVLQRFDIHITAGASGTINAYQNGTPVFTDPGAGLNAAVTNFAAVRFSAITGGTCVYSQLLGADFDTRDSRLGSQLANGNGANTDGTGAYTDINEPVLAEDTAIALSATGQKKSFTHPTFTLPAGYQIGAVGVAGRGRINGTGPSDGKFELHTGGVDYASSSLGLNTGYEPRGRYWTADPSTASDWTQTGYNNAEFGVEAA